MRVSDHPRHDALEPLFEGGKLIEPVSDITRARSLVRARALLAESPLASVPDVRPQRTSRRSTAFAAAAALTLIATGAAATYWGHISGGSRPELAPLQPRAVRVVATTAPISPAPSGPEESRSRSALNGTRSTRSVGLRGGEGEMALIHRTKAAYAAGDDTAVLGLVAEHTRRFPRGRLAEEREGFRIRSLLRRGRSEEARRALDSFGDRFPHSVLFPSLQRATADGRKG